MKDIKKAVIPVAGFGTRFLPFTKAMPKEMLPIIDKPTIQFIVEELVACGITDILLVTSSHANKRAIEDHFDQSIALEQMLTEKEKFIELKEINEISNLANIHYIRQKEIKGLGDAILCAESFIGDEPFAVILGDDIVVNDNEPVIGQLIKTYQKFNTSILGTQEVLIEDINKYGIVQLEKKKKDGKIIDIIEKPSLNIAPSNNAVLGRYILTPTIFKYLKVQKPGMGNEIQLTDAIKSLLNEEDVHICNFIGKRYDIGDKLGFIKAIIDFSLKDQNLSCDVYKYLEEIINDRNGE